MFKKELRGTSLVVQWLRLCAPNAGGVGKSFIRRASVAAGMVGKKQVKSRRAIKSRFFNVSGTGQKLKGNEVQVAGPSMELKCSILNII